jgi:hypothetical protein
LLRLQFSGLRYAPVIGRRQADDCVAGQVTRSETEGGYGAPRNPNPPESNRRRHQNISLILDRHSPGRLSVADTVIIV